MSGSESGSDTSVPAVRRRSPPARRTGRAAQPPPAPRSPSPPGRAAQSPPARSPSASPPGRAAQPPPARQQPADARPAHRGARVRGRGRGRQQGAPGGQEQPAGLDLAAAVRQLVANDGEFLRVEQERLAELRAIRRLAEVYSLNMARATDAFIQHLDRLRRD